LRKKSESFGCRDGGANLMLSGSSVMLPYYSAEAC
jgi:hypothetical protein